ncbi:toxin-antitoxin system YwqK family antitoxin [Lysobacter sp. cf310]|uniref:toxin-antitoxin system YwqK family antitoxin n=1 Tax=Lysobacter sp. cf310 TaxID=1761790 RepID=UPI0008F171FD|nr:hypothetical protein [Lysobacter sp. cf310]SFK94605.1 MORN repeat variant [Lysobacter sp. cf310]
MTDLQIAEIPYPSGAVRFRYSRYLSADGSAWVRHGLFCAYHKDGSLASEGNYEHGQEHGQWRDYHTNGQLAAEGSYANGAETGIWRYWSADGSPEPSGAAKQFIQAEAASRLGLIQELDAMRRLSALAAAIIAIALPFYVYCALSPGPDFRDGAMMWLLLMLFSLFVSLVLSGTAGHLGQASYMALPAPRPLLRKLELGVTMLPVPLLVLVVVGWVVVRAVT